MGVKGTRDAPELGVYFQRKDYAGFWVRLVVVIIDVVVFGVLLFLVLALVFPILPEDGRAKANLFVVSAAGLSFLYFVVLKRSTIRTLGYIVGKVRIVDLHGRRPSIGALVMRLMFAVLGPFNFLIDLVWITSDSPRQALRDKYAHTYVIKKDAQPVGTGPIVYSTYHMLGMIFMFPEVKSTETRKAP